MFYSSLTSPQFYPAWDTPFRDLFFTALDDLVPEFDNGFSSLLGLIDVGDSCTAYHVASMCAAAFLADYRNHRGGICVRTFWRGHISVFDREALYWNPVNDALPLREWLGPDLRGAAAVQRGSRNEVEPDVGPTLAAYIPQGARLSYSGMDMVFESDRDWLAFASEAAPSWMIEPYLSEMEKRGMDLADGPPPSHEYTFYGIALDLSTLHDGATCGETIAAIAERYDDVAASALGLALSALR